MIKNRQFPALRDSEAERRRSDHARQPPLLREGGLRRVERIRQRHLQLFSTPRATATSTFAILKHNNACGIALCGRRPSSLFGRCRMIVLFFFLYFPFLTIARKAEPEAAVAEVRSAVEPVRPTTVPHKAIVAATTAHTDGTR